MKYIIMTLVFVFWGCGIAQANEDIFYSGQRPNNSGIQAEDYIKKLIYIFRQKNMVLL